MQYLKIQNLLVSDNTITFRHLNPVVYEHAGVKMKRSMIRTREEEVRGEGGKDVDREDEHKKSDYFYNSP
jgi:hypothetical protein